MQVHLDKMHLQFKYNFALMLLASSICLTSAIGKSDWWKHAIIYEIHPRSFYDSNLDGIGDLRGITTTLEYFVELGVTALLLSSIFPAQIENFTEIDPALGDKTDLEKLIERAKLLDIKILLDISPFETSIKCEWFKKSSNRIKGFEDFYIWVKPRYDENHTRQPLNSSRCSTLGRNWTWHDKRKECFKHQISSKQPALNYLNLKAREEMDLVLLFWLEKGIHGYRVNGINNMFESLESTHTQNMKDSPLHLLSGSKDMPEPYKILWHWRKLLDNYTEKIGGPSIILTTIAKATIRNQMNFYEYHEGIPIAHFPFNSLFISDLSRDTDARDFVHVIQKWITYMPQGHVANWVSGRCGVERLATRFSPELVDAMNMLLLTLPGVVITYNGDEIGVENHQDINHEEIINPNYSKAGMEKHMKTQSEPLPFEWNNEKSAGLQEAEKSWLPVHLNYLRINLKQQKEAAKSHYKVYKVLSELRKNRVLREGGLHMMALNRDVFAFKREVPSASPVFITVINVSNKMRIVDLTLLGELPSKLKILVAGPTTTYEVGNIINTSNLTLHNFECLLLQGNFSMSAERRALIKTLIKSANVILVGLLMYKLWNNKWTKLNFSNKEALF